MRYTTFILLAVLLSVGCKKDNPQPQVRVDLKAGDFDFVNLASLPNVIDESSGLEIAGGFEFWSHNDRGDDAKLYQFDTTGNLSRTLTITNANNVDWEDMTQDDYGNVYVGDFGNNDNDRNDLVIYKIAASELSGTNNNVSASKIEFSFPQQTAFPPPESEHFYDVESMFSKGSYLYLLTRDRSKPFVGKTTLYRIPNTEGVYEAEYLNEFLTDSKKSIGQITAADLSPDGRVLAMISSERMWLFQNIVGENFFGAEILSVNLPLQLDMEGLIFQDDCTLFMSNEDKPNDPAILYRVTLCL